jgi:hypothetical protein
MGFWNVKAKDLQVGDEIRWSSAAFGENFQAVQAVEDPDNRWVRVRLQNVDKNAQPYWDLLKKDEQLTVRR